jgi:hypothetical protein
MHWSICGRAGLPSFSVGPHHAVAGVHARGQCNGKGNAVHDRASVDHKGRRRDQPVSLRQLEFDDLAGFPLVDKRTGS